MALLCLIAGLAAAPVRARAERVLLAVGSSQGLPDEWPLTYAVRDAERLAQLMVELGDVAPINAHVLRDPSLDDFVRALREIAKSTGPSATFLLYYSGHGSASALHVRGETLAGRALRTELARVPAALDLVVIDACRGSVSHKGFKEAEPFTVSISASPDHKGFVVLHAAGAGEAALESNRLQSGVFSHFLRSALRGAADRDGDGRISLSEAYDHAYSGTLETSAGSSNLLQHPTLDLDMQGIGPLVITRVAPARSLLKLPRAREELYVVFKKGSNAAYAEAWSKPDRATAVALPAGQFVIYRRTGNSQAATEVNLPFGGERQLSSQDFLPTTTGTLTRRGGNYAQYDRSLALRW